MDSQAVTDAPLIGEPLPVELMNTVWADRNAIHDSLATAEGAGSWLSAVAERLPPLQDDFQFGETDTSDLRGLRDAARRLAAHCTQDPRHHAGSATVEVGEAVAVLNALAGRSPSWPVVELADASSFSARSQAAGPPSQALLSFLAAETIDLFGQGERLELRACLAPGCVLYFVKDHPRREWCGTACGNRARAARHYARHGRTR